MPPVIAPTGLLIGVVHVYVVPLGTIFPLPFVGVTVKAIPEQMVGVVPKTKGLGFTTTVMVNVLPTQFPVSPEVGVTV